MLEDRTFSNSIETVICLLSGILLFWRRLWRVACWLFQTIRIIILSIDVACKVRAKIVSLESLKGDLMAGKFGIKETKDLMAFGIALAIAGYTAKKNDGVIDGKDLALLLPPMMELPNAIDGVSEVISEIKDLDEAELLEIKDFILLKMPEAGERWRQIAVHSLMIASGAIGLWADFNSKPLDA